MLKELQIKLNFYWKLFEWIKDRYEKTSSIKHDKNNCS
jgi:hypothetical protein